VLHVKQGVAVLLHSNAQRISLLQRQYRLYAADITHRELASGKSRLQPLAALGIDAVIVHPLGLALIPVRHAQHSQSQRTVTDLQSKIQINTNVHSGVKHSFSKGLSH
jgi:hypothetical protein